jgi:hypothetical protein
MCLHFGDVHFGDVHFDDVHFGNVHFGDVHFGDVHFDDVHFDDAHFGDVHFDDVHFDDAQQLCGSNKHGTTRLLCAHGNMVGWLAECTSPPYKQTGHQKHWKGAFWGPLF